MFLQIGDPLNTIYRCGVFGEYRQSFSQEKETLFSCELPLLIKWALSGDVEMSRIREAVQARFFGRLTALGDTDIEGALSSIP